MNPLCFSLNTDVRGKGRPRFGNGKTYTDAKTVAYERQIGWAAKAAMGAQGPFPGAVCVTIAARFQPPASASRAARAGMLSGETPPIGRIDVDNAGKAVLDGLNGVAFADDRQVVSLMIRKVYAETPGLDVVIRPYVAPQAAQGIAA